MATPFRITTHLNLIASQTDIRTVRKQIETGLQNIGVTVNTQAAGSIRSLSKQLMLATHNANRLATAIGTVVTQASSLGLVASPLAQVQKQTQLASVATKQLGSHSRSTSNDLSGLAASTQLATKRFAAYVGGALSLRVAFNYLRSSVRDSIEYERSLVKVSQVMGASAAEAKAFGVQLRSLGSDIGVSSDKLLASSQDLLAAGFSFSQVQNVIRTIGEASLGASFGNDLTQISDALILLREQFKQTRPDEFISSRWARLEHRSRGREET
jgi:hypothetical protein